MASWLPPDFENGNIVAYTLFCRMALDQEYTIRGVLNSSTSSATIMDLMPFTSYECYVTANTSVGEGPTPRVQEVPVLSSSMSDESL